MIDPMVIANGAKNRPQHRILTMVLLTFRPANELAASPLQAERWFSAADREMQAETFAHP
jgi:hypothetical protein